MYVDLYNDLGNNDPIRDRLYRIYGVYWRDRRNRTCG
jgi:hypothetical protein